MNMWLIFTLGTIFGCLAMSLLYLIFFRPTIGVLFIDSSDSKDYYRFAFDKDPEIIKKKKHICFVVKNDVIIDDLHDAEK